MKILIWLKKLAIVFKNARPNKFYKLVGIKPSRDQGYDICMVQFAGQNIFIEMDPLSLINNTEMLNEFSITDIIKIVKLANDIEHNLFLKKLKLVEISLQDSYKIYAQAIGSQHYHTIFLETLEANKQLVNRFDPSDAFYLGRLVEQNVQLLERRRLNELKKDNLSPKFIIIDGNNRL